MKLIFQSRAELKAELVTTNDDIRKKKYERFEMSLKLTSTTSSLDKQVVDGITAEKDKILRIQGDLESIDAEILELTKKARRIKRRLSKIDKHIKDLTGAEAELCRMVYIDGLNISDAVNKTLEYCSINDIKSSESTLWRIWKNIRLDGDREWVKN
jgi:hypothetical protein